MSLGSKLIAVFVLVTGFYPLYPSRAAPSETEETRVTRPHAVSVEVFGRALSFSVNYDRSFERYFSAGFGLSQIATYQNSQVRQAVTYFNAYFLPEFESAFVTVGLNRALNADLAKFKDTSLGRFRFPEHGWVSQVGLGWEHRLSQGFLFRSGAYVLFGDNVLPWFGFSVGYAF